jgi:hypothetical protein
MLRVPCPVARGDRRRRSCWAEVSPGSPPRGCSRGTSSTSSCSSATRDPTSTRPTRRFASWGRAFQPRRQLLEDPVAEECNPLRDQARRRVHQVKGRALRRGRRRPLVRHPLPGRDRRHDSADVDAGGEALVGRDSPGGPVEPDRVSAAQQDGAADRAGELRGWPLDRPRREISRLPRARPHRHRRGTRREGRHLGGDRGDSRRWRCPCARARQSHDRQRAIPRRLHEQPRRLVHVHDLGIRQPEPDRAEPRRAADASRFSARRVRPSLPRHPPVGAGEIRRVGTGESAVGSARPRSVPDAGRRCIDLPRVAGGRRPSSGR